MALLGPTKSFNDFRLYYMIFEPNFNSNPSCLNERVMSPPHKHIKLCEGGGSNCSDTMLVKRA